MAGSPSDHDVFELRRIRRLVALLKEHDLSEIDLRQGETRIQLRRGGAPEPVAAETPHVAPAASLAEQTPAPAAEKPPDSKNIVEIKSPMVGTFYAAADPDAPTYVKVGDHVGPETTVCIVEAMKVFNQIPAEVSGKIVSVLVENGEPVEFGQPMFKVDTRE